MISLFVAVVFIIAATPGSMAMPLVPQAPEPSMAGMDSSDQMPTDCGHMKMQPGKSEPCKGVGICLGMLSCFGMAALAADHVAPKHTSTVSVVAIAHQVIAGLTLQPDNPPPIA